MNVAVRNVSEKAISASNKRSNCVDSICGKSPIDSAAKGASGQIFGPAREAEAMRRGGGCDVDIGAAGALGTKLHTSLLQVCETSLSHIGLEGHETHTLGHNLQKFPRNAARNSTLYLVKRQN